MAINQAILTSSARGIEKGGGLGIHTYNRACSEFELSEFEQSFCAYFYDGDSSKIPSLPKKALFKKIDGQRYMQALVTYLGQDYAGTQGRMGNLFSHMYTFDPEDIRVYPMQLYDSPDFLSSLSREELDGSKQVEYLPEVKQVRPGTAINIERIQEFLGDSDRMEFFCHLLAAVLARDEIHKVIIYDTHENILLWLAAIQFALPLQSAIEVSYSSLEHNPTMSEFDIRGAVPGLSKGKLKDYSNGGQFYVFDGMSMYYPKFDISADYFQDGIQMCLAYAYDSLEEFFKFIRKYHYHKADQDLCAGFKLFQMVQGGMDILGEDEFEQGVSFERKYGSKESYQSILKGMSAKLEDSPQEDLDLLKNTSIWLAGYFSRKLDFEEWTFAAACAMKLEQYAKNAPAVRQEREKIWELLLKSAPDTESLDKLAKQLCQAGEYQRLGTLSAHLVRKASSRLSAKYLGQVFSHFFSAAPPSAYRYFDPAVQEAAAILQQREPEERFHALISTFLSLQELGDGEIAGEGMDQILAMIEADTDLESLKSPRVLTPRKKEELKELEQVQSKCAFEAFNYTQKHKSAVSVSKIRLLHLGRCIRKAYEDEIPLARSKTLKIYAQYPVTVEGVSNEELENYFKVLCKTISTMVNEREDYVQLLTYWILEERQKELWVGMLFDQEWEYKQKDGQDQGLAALLDAIRFLKDNEYTEAIVRVTEARKGGKKGGKGAKGMKGARGTEGAKGTASARAEAKDTKKSFFNFKKH